MNRFKSFIFLILIWGIFLNTVPSQARPYYYPQVRYQDAQSFALGGVTLPLTESVMGNLMNNPAALAKYGAFQGEFFNLHLDANGNSLGILGQPTLTQTTLNGFKGTLNANQNKQYSLGYSASSAFSWEGIGVGILVQDRVRAVSDGSRIYYDAVSQTIPTAGIGIPLARGVVRLGYSLQFVNEAYGGGSVNATTGPFGYHQGIAEGHGFSHNASVNFVFPFTYLPTISLEARNIMGLHYFPSSLYSKATQPSGAPADEPMVIDAAVNYTIRLAGTTRTNWYFQYKDPFGAVRMPVLERMSAGLELLFSNTFALRGGMSGANPSAGFGYNTDTSGVNMAWYHEQSPLPVGDKYDSRWVLQYVLKLKDRATRDRSKEK